MSWIAEDWTVSLTHTDGHPDIELRPLAGSVLGQPHGFGVERVDDGWRAIATCGTFSVEVEGPGEPPARLDLDDPRWRR